MKEPTKSTACLSLTLSIPEFGNESEDIFDQSKKYIAQFKKAILMIAGAAVQKLALQLSKEQEILTNIADMVIDLYTAESLQLRVEKLTSIRGREATAVQQAMMKTFIYDAADRIAKNGKDAICSFAEGDEQRIMLMGLKRFTKTEPINIKEARRIVAKDLIEKNGYNY